MKPDFFFSLQTGWHLDSRRRYDKGANGNNRLDRCFMRQMPASLLVILAAALPVAIIGCGSQASNPVSSAPDFTLTASPVTLNLMAGATGEMVAVTANALYGFTGSVSVNLSGLPAGVTSNPSTLTLSPGMAQNVTLTAPTSTAAG